jgi:hypothetical protein
VRTLLVLVLVVLAVGCQERTCARHEWVWHPGQLVEAGALGFKFVYYQDSWGEHVCHQWEPGRL